MRHAKIDIGIGPTLVVTHIKRLAICPCGNRLYREGVEVSTEYQVDIKSVRWGKFQCHGCGKELNVRFIDQYSEIDPKPRYALLDTLVLGEAIPKARKPDSSQYKKMRKPS